MNFPFVHTAGDTLDFQVTAPYLSSAGWTLKYRLTPRFVAPTQAPIAITANANADGSYQVQVDPAVTALWAPGAYGWSRWVEKSGARQTLTSSADQGEVQVRPNPTASAQGDDSRSHARIMLEQIESAIQALNFGAKSYTIGSRSFTSFDKAELITMHDRYRKLVADEDAAAAVAAGNQNPRKVAVRFDDIR